MTQFSFKARNSDGQLITGMIQAENSLDARTKLLEKDLFITSLKSSILKEIINRIFIPTVPLEELLIFNRQLQIVYSVGIPLLKGIKTIYIHTGNKILKDAIRDIIEKLSEGMELSRALSFHPNIFDTTYISLIKAGELSGKLEEILERISIIAETKVSNEQKVKAALFYPKIVIGVMAVVFFVVMGFILPKMKKFYVNLGTELPGITKFMMAVSNFVMSWGFLLIIAAVLGLFFYIKMNLTDKIIDKMHEWMLKAPIFGSLFLEIDINSFCVVLELMLKSGVTLLDSLKVVRSTMQNKILAKEIIGFEEAITEGQTLSSALFKSKYFPVLIKNFISIGEEAGAIERVLEKISTYYKRQVEFRVDSLSKIIEPILLAIIFGSVLMLALAVFLPMWKMGSGVHK